MKQSRLVHSPVGPLRVSEENGRVTALEFDAPGALGGSESPVLLQAERQLAEYFAGSRKAFDLPLTVSGTAFQKAVWAALVSIPYGETRTYGFLARAAGSPGAARAAGGACNRNPLAIIIPCHRAIGADGSLTGFGGGLDTKAALLNLEKGHSALPD
jgi:methylated-DNA-[protein]-cysteine S-methyltransferase